MHLEFRLVAVGLPERDRDIALEWVKKLDQSRLTNKLTLADIILVPSDIWCGDLLQELQHLDQFLYDHPEVSFQEQTKDYPMPKLNGPDEPGVPIIPANINLSFFVDLPRIFVGKKPESQVTLQDFIDVAKDSLFWSPSDEDPLVYGIFINGEVYKDPAAKRMVEAVRQKQASLFPELDFRMRLFLIGEDERVKIYQLNHH